MRKYLILLDRANRANRAGTPFYFLISVYLEAPPHLKPALFALSNNFSGLRVPHYCPITAPFNAIFLLNLLILLIILLFSFFFFHEAEKVKRFFGFWRASPCGHHPQAVHLD